MSRTKWACGILHSTQRVKDTACCYLHWRVNDRICNINRCKDNTNKLDMQVF